MTKPLWKSPVEISVYLNDEYVDESESFADKIIDSVIHDKINGFGGKYILSEFLKEHPQLKKSYIQNIIFVPEDDYEEMQDCNEMTYRSATFAILYSDKFNEAVMKEYDENHRKG